MVLNLNMRTLHCVFPRVQLYVHVYFYRLVMTSRRMFNPGIAYMQMTVCSIGRWAPLMMRWPCKHLSEIEKWCVEWKLTLNVKKYLHLSSYNGSRHFKYPYFLYNERVSTKTEVKYLGTIFSSNCLWEVHVTSIAQKASSMLNFLQSNLKLLAS